MRLRRGRKGKTAAGTASPGAEEAGVEEEGSEESDEDEGGNGSSLSHAQRVMDKAVAQMMLMDQELEDVRAQEATFLQSSSISQAEYDAKMAAIQAAFDAKEAELKAEVDAAKAAIEAAETQKRAEAETEAKAAEEAKDELAKMRAEAEHAREEAAALRAEAAAQRQRAEEEREQREKARQEELNAARQEIASARQEAEAARADAQAQREEQERREKAAADEREAAVLAQKRAEAEEVKEEDTQVASVQPAVVLPVPDSSVPDTVKPDDADEAQPTAAGPAPASVGPYSGTVNLNDVLLKVEKLFLTGKNFFRFQYSKTGVVIVAVFLRVIGDEYVLCWARGNSRTVHPSRSLAFSDIRAIVVGKQSSVFRRAEFSLASNAQCFSIVGGRHCLHLMAGNERDAEMTAFGLASLLKESRLTVNVFDHGQYREADDVVLTETAQEQSEEDDDAPLADLTDSDQLTTGTSVQRVSVSACRSAATTCPSPTRTPSCAWWTARRRPTASSTCRRPRRSARTPTPSSSASSPWTTSWAPCASCASTCTTWGRSRRPSTTATAWAASRPTCARWWSTTAWSSCTR